MSRPFNRRQVIAGAGACTLGAGMLPLSAWAANDAQERLLAFTGGSMPQTGRITLDVPQTAENGNSVPLAVDVDSPMTDDDHVEAVLLLADGNLRGTVATFRFTPLSARAQVATRIRLGGTQTVMAVARMSDGTCFMDSQAVEVAIAGCAG